MLLGLGSGVAAAAPRRLSLSSKKTSALLTRNWGWGRTKGLGFRVWNLEFVKRKGFLKFFFKFSFSFLNSIT